jgi:hypothetical protein
MDRRTSRLIAVAGLILIVGVVVGAWLLAL